jgi:alpha-1,2-mannosyltransferase
VSFFRSSLWRAGWPPIVFLASAAIVAAGVAQWTPVPILHPFWQYHFFDLRVYRKATWVALSGHQLYTAHLRHGLGFTYPPFAVLAMLPLRWLNLFHDEIAATAANIVLVAVGAHAAVRLRNPSEGRARAGWIAAAIALWAEPVISTIGYGQIDLLIAALVTVDLAYGRGSRAGGLGIGLAAALKLTPLIFIPYLLFTHRGRMASRALGAFLASIVVAFIAVPHDAARYWGGTIFDISRVTGRHPLSGSGPVNQSLRGALVRLLPGTAHMSMIWLPACLLVASIGLLLAVSAARHGNELHGFLLAAITGLLISPVSWTHHWAIIVPGLLATVTTTARPATRRLLTLLALELAVSSSAIWLVIALDPVGTPLGVAGQLFADAYVLFGLAILGSAAALQLRRLASTRGPLPDLGGVRPHPLRIIPEAVSGP